MQKWMKWTLTGLGALAIVGGIVAYGPVRSVLASDAMTRPWMEFMPKIMQQRAAAHLETLVNESKLTQQEADQLQALMKSEMESRMASHADKGGHEGGHEGVMTAEIDRLVEQGKLSTELAGKLKNLMPTMMKQGMHGEGKGGHGPMGDQCPIDQSN